MCVCVCVHVALMSHACICAYMYVCISKICMSHSLSLTNERMPASSVTHSGVTDAHSGMRNVPVTGLKKEVFTLKKSHTRIIHKSISASLSPALSLHLNWRHWKSSGDHSSLVRARSQPRQTVTGRLSDLSRRPLQLGN